MLRDRSSRSPARVYAQGKFLYAKGEKIHVRGVTYGTFRPDENGAEIYNPRAVERDFAHMAACGISAVRTYAIPPVWLLDLAEKYGLHIMAGLAWEQHVTFLDSRWRRNSIRKRVLSAVRACASHPSILCFAVGNEIPAQIVRWHGARRIERWLERLYEDIKAEDAESLVTYVNYPSTEYLQLPFLDLVCFNVFIESPELFGSYLARLQNIAGDRPLVLAEIGLDSLRHGEDGQAVSVGCQIRTAFENGCAGTFVFAWTDEWHRGGQEVSDWRFGLTRSDRSPKPALEAVRRAYATLPFSEDIHWPGISVIVCSRNGERSIGQCLEAVKRLDYPDYEVIVVDDGSTDATARIATQFNLRLIRTERRGLSSARNTGLRAARGEIVAYIDDDAYPDQHWLKHLAMTFLITSHAGAGGPNIPPPDLPFTSQCVALAPGGPIHVLTSDTEAEHIPGCNMAFRRVCLEAIGGFDPAFRIAGDDVDVCWRLQQQGWTLGFSHGAVVWHHRRDSIRAYWKQQQGYGNAEALLEAKWPERYNNGGHLTWAGRVYTRSRHTPFRRRAQVFYGVWGAAPFQSVYAPGTDRFSSLPLTPEWLLAVCGLLILAVLGILWRPLLLAVPIALLAVAATAVQAVVHARRTPSYGCLWRRLTFRPAIAALHLIQPLARFWGRLCGGLTLWRRRKLGFFEIPGPRTQATWSERWRPPPAWIESLESRMRESGACVTRGGDFDRWDLSVRAGTFGHVKVFAVVEEHGSGRQLVRYRWSPRLSTMSFALLAVLGVPATAAAIDEAWTAAIILSVFTMLALLRSISDCGVAGAAVRSAVSSETTNLEFVRREPVAMAPRAIATHPERVE